MGDESGKTISGNANSGPAMSGVSKDSFKLWNYQGLANIGEASVVKLHAFSCKGWSFHGGIFNWLATRVEAFSGEPTSG